MQCLVARRHIISVTRSKFDWNSRARISMRLVKEGLGTRLLFLCPRCLGVATLHSSKPLLQATHFRPQHGSYLAKAIPHVVRPISATDKYQTPVKSATISVWKTSRPSFAGTWLCLGPNTVVFDLRRRNIWPQAVERGCAGAVVSVSTQFRSQSSPVFLAVECVTRAERTSSVPLPQPAVCRGRLTLPRLFVLLAQHISLNTAVY